MRSLKSSPTTVYFSHVRYKATAQGSPEGRDDQLSVRKPNVAAVVSDRLGLIPMSNSCTGPEHSCVCLCLTNYAAAALPPADSVRSLVPHAVQQRRLCRCRNCEGCCYCRLGGVSFLSVCLCCNSAPPAVAETGAPLLLLPIESRISSAHRAASVTLQPKTGLLSVHNLCMRRCPLLSPGHRSAEASSYRDLSFTN